MSDRTKYGAALTEDDAIDVAQCWAKQHAVSIVRSKKFALQWHGESSPDERYESTLRTELTFFFEASTKDSQYWNSVSSFTEDATGDWGLQALKALGALNLAGLAAGVILLIGYPVHARPIGAMAASASFLLGLLLTFPALKLTGKSRGLAESTASLHSREAGVASTWEQLRLANTADPNAGRRERKIAVKMAWIIIASLIIGCIALISTAWL